jgi:class 3 adenylate cyclase/tetratricopeptide (TPR) repeat protein
MPTLPTGIITYLLTDIEGSTSIWERNPDAMRAAMIRHDALMTTGIERHGGVVVKSRGEGDSVFAVFARADAAVAAATDVQGSLHAVSWPEAAQLRVRMALLTGPSEVRDQDYQGSVVNRCARLREIAHGGQVLLSASTAGLVKDTLPGGVHLRDLGERHLRSFAVPEHVFELLISGVSLDQVRVDKAAEDPHDSTAHPVGSHPPINGAPGGAEDSAATADDLAPTPYSPPHPFPKPPVLVGRGREIESILPRLSSVADGGRVVFISGPAGIGKSALVGELLLQARRAGMLCLVGRSYEQEHAAPLTPFHDALADYLLSQTPERLRATLGSMVGEFAHMVPELRAHLGLRETPARDVDLLRIFGAVRLLLRRAAEPMPVVLCLEDLHAADEASLQLLHHLARYTPRLRLLLVCTFRTEPGPSLTSLTQIASSLLQHDVLQAYTLSPLDVRGSERLVSNVLDGQVADRLSDAIYAICEGNPLFTEQLVLGLVERGSLERRAGVWHGSLDGEDRPPGAVLDVISQRLAGLTPSCRQTLQRAAVFGQSVDHSVLQATLPMVDETQLVLDLEEAIGAHLLIETGAGYRFSHALLREAVYWGLSAPRRRLFHAQAGEVLERVYGGRRTERAAELARHFALASETSEIRRKLLTYSLEAGRRAASLSSHREALTHFTRGCELLDLAGTAEELSPEERLGAWEGRGSTERAIGLWEASVESFRRSLAMTVDPLRRARSHAAIGYAHQRTGDSITAMAHYDTGLRELDAAGEARDVVIARIRLQSDQAYIHFLHGQFEQQLDLGYQMLPAALDLGEVRPIMWAHNLTALAYMGLGRGQPALQHFREAVAAAGRTEDKVDVALARSNLGIFFQYAGKFALARSELEVAIEIHHEAAADRRAVNSMQRLARVLLAEGNVAGALEHANQALALAVEVHDRWEADCLDVLGAIHAVRAEWTRAESSYRQALALRERADHRAGLIESLLGLGLVQERRGDWTAAQATYATAGEHARRMDPNPWLLSALRHLGRLLHRRGERDAAREHLAEAVKLADTMVDTVELAPLQLTLVECDWFGPEIRPALAALGRALTSGATVELAVDVYAARARLRQQASQLVEARADVDEALRLAQQLRSPRSQAVAQCAAAQQAHAEADYGSVATWYEAALTSARAASTPYELALILRASAASERADAGRARQMLDEATAIPDRLGSGASADSGKQP